MGNLEKLEKSMLLQNLVSDDMYLSNILHILGDEIARIVRKRTCCRLIWKEKFGSLRYEMVLPPHISPRGSWIDRTWAGWGWKATFTACLKMAELYPEFEDEILTDIASWEDLVGTELHNKYWRGFE